MKKKKVNVDHVTRAFHGNRFDPSGSYTGVPQQGARPTQDADDL